MKKQENINASRRGFIKTPSLGLAGTSLAGGSVSALLSTEAKAAEMQTVMTAAHWGAIRRGSTRWQSGEIRPCD